MRCEDGGVTAGCFHSSGLSLIMMMESSHFRHRNHPASIWRGDGAWLWAIHGEREMRAPAMVIVEILLQEPLEVTFAQHDHVIQAPTADWVSGSSRAKTYGKPYGFTLRH
jgi:hypothetical protein